MPAISTTSKRSSAPPLRPRTLSRTIPCRPSSHAESAALPLCHPIVHSVCCHPICHPSCHPIWIPSLRYVAKLKSENDDLKQQLKQLSASNGKQLAASSKQLTATGGANKENRRARVAA